MKYTNKHGLPESLVNAIGNDNYDFIPDEKRISVTQLINSPLVRKLKLKHGSEIEEDVMDNVWRLFGSAVHSVIERVDQKGSLKEERLEQEIDGITISGQADLYHEKVIEDYKVTSAWSLCYNPEGKEEWLRQLNVYAWLFRKAGHEVKKLRIVAILRDWDKRKALPDSNYPMTPIVVVNVHLWPEAMQLAYIKDRIAIHQTDHICTEKERWTTETTWAVKKTGVQKAKKVCQSEEEAIKWMGDQKGLYIEERKGSDRRCEDYCSVNKWCPEYNKKER